MSNPWSLSVSKKSANFNHKRKKEVPLDDVGFRTAGEQLMLSSQQADGKFKNRNSRTDSFDAVSSTTTMNRNSIRNTLSQPSSTQNLPPYQPFQPNYNSQGKRLGTNGPFINPLRKSDDNGYGGSSFSRPCNQNDSSSNKSTYSSNVNKTNAFTGNQPISTELREICSNEKAKNLDANIVERILNEIIDKKSELTWDEIGGLNKVKQELKEIVMLPMIRPDLFVGLLSPCKGLLLFGPPGTGE